MVSALATLVLGFGLASASVLPSAPGKAAPPPPPGPHSPSPPPGPKGPKGPKDSPPPPPPAPYQSISSGSVIIVTPSASSTAEPTTTGDATDVISAPSPSTTESPVAATCDTDLTITSTLTYDYPNTVYEFTTTTLPTSTRGTVTIYTSMANTSTSSYLGDYTEVTYVNDLGTSTQTLYDYVSTGVCDETATV